jgi:lipopolysaccharide transport system ATP-binding protein
MSDLAIRVENLGKQYRIGAAQKRHSTLRDAIGDWRLEIGNWISRLARPTSNFQPPTSNSTIWALKDVSFDVQRGEVVGIIGRNGAGKSTLLKILSSITKPTEGRVTLNGRVGSLLEVGTGFHAELTGRENIFLNGAILGMSKREIEKKFDEIVAFAEVEKFIDTPVKHYSSGMYVRLAFAVAAHLEPEILVVDEVLAVGDAQFQKKCLGKMGEVSRLGRTILYVSHNMTSVKMLCSSAMLLEDGRIKQVGVPSEVITKYLSSSSDVLLAREWPKREGPGDEYFRMIRFEILQQGNIATGHIVTDSPLDIKFVFEILYSAPHLQVGFELATFDGQVIFQSYHSDVPDVQTFEAGIHSLFCSIPPGNFNQGMYIIRPMVALYCTRWIINRISETELTFNTTLDQSRSPLWHVAREGVLAPSLVWRRQKEH